MSKRTYKEVKHGRGMVARMTQLGENVIHVFVEHPWEPYEGKRLDEFHVQGGFFEAMKVLNLKYGRAFVRCDDKLFGY